MPDQKVSPYHLFYESPIGWLKIEASEKSVTGLRFCETKDIGDNPNNVTEEVSKQLQEYFEKKRKYFDLKIEMTGTDFQMKVWKELTFIPYGETLSYLKLSQRLGNVKAIRAVGHANGQNPLPVIVPCHRVIGNDGRLVGYGGGLWRKKWLLQHEDILPQELNFVTRSE